MPREPDVEGRPLFDYLVALQGGQEEAPAEEAEEEDTAQPGWPPEPVNGPPADNTSPAGRQSITPQYLEPDRKRP